MFVRCAYFEGDVAPENRERFDRVVDQEIAPLMARFPKVRAVRILRGDWFEDAAPRYYQTFEMQFDTAEDIEAALQAPVRKQIHAKLSEILPLFDGSIKHINHRVTEVMPSG